MNYQYDNRMLSGRTADDGTPCGFGGCRYSRPEDRSDRFEDWSPKLGALYQIHDNHQFYINLSQGFRAPKQRSFIACNGSRKLPISIQKP